MAEYRVFVRTDNHAYVDVEADSLEEAIEAVRDGDGDIDADYVEWDRNDVSEDDVMVFTDDGLVSAKPKGARPPKSTELGVCAECGCADIEVTAWVSLNTGEVVDGGDGPTDQVWCPECEAETSVEWKGEPNA